jgi:predicted secreted hydrolase
MRRALGLLVAAALLLAPWVWMRRLPEGQDQSPVVRLGAAPPDPGFARALRPRPFRLPEDHGPHFEFQTEWWYYTGNLTADDGAHFGFQLTFFRRGLSPTPPPDGPGLATNQIYAAHFAIADAGSLRHRFFERSSRGAAGLAGALGSPFRVWLEDWQAEGTNSDGSRVHLTARDGEATLDLELRAQKVLVAHGDRGLSAKSDAPGNASYYLGYTRLAAKGQIGVGRATRAVQGEAWFDHEWSTSALGPGAVGWDWFSLQLDDGRELMLYFIRRADGSRESASEGTLVARDGIARRLSAKDIAVEVVSHWKSPVTKAEYPSGWRLRLPSEDLALDIVPWLASQEMRTSFAYWEGAVRVEGKSHGEAVHGNGYVELTGYARSLGGVF